MSSATKANGKKAAAAVQPRNLGGPWGASFTGEGTKGLSWPRRHTTPGVDPYDEIEWELRTAGISSESGKSVFEQKDVEVPKAWSQLATNVVVSKYFRGHVGTPERERSVKQLIDRVVNTIAAWAESQHTFATDEDLAAFRAELTHLLVHQKMAFNSPVWFNVGVEPRPQCSACQPYHALVSTPDGMVPIGQLVDEGAIGREVYDANGVTRVVAVKNNGRKPVRRIRLRNGNFIEATPDHVVKAARQRRTATEWLPVEALEVGMRLHLHPHRAKVATRALVPAGFGALAGELSVFEPIEKQAAILTAEAALAGWLQADGFVGQYETGTNRSLTIEFQVANDDEYRWVMDNLDVALPHVHVKVRDADTKEIRVRRIRVYGEVVRDFVERWGLLERGTEIRVPSRLWTASYDEISAYLRSIFQADGYISVRRDHATGGSARIGFAVIGERWTEDVQLLLNVLGIYSRRTHKREKRADRHDLHEVAISVGSERARFAELVGFIGREKQARLRESLGLAGRKAVPNVREEEIVAIEELGVQEVYDIQTESGEYLSNNVAVHNCFINSVQDSMSSIMDLAKTEAMLFKFGSGAGSNLSPIRSAREKMTGGGTASGPVSFMKGYDAFAGVVKCLTGDTYVTTGGGLLRIDEAIETEGAVGFEESDALTLNTPAGPVRISHIYRSPLASVRTARLRTGLELTGTHEHPVMTLTSGFELHWKKLADLRVGDRVAVERRRELWPSGAPRLDTFSSDLMVERRKLRYPTEMTPELARLLGYLVAEGSVEGERFRFTSADPEIMADYCRCVDAVFGVDPSRQVRSRIHPTTGVTTESIELSWKGALQFFEYCGLPASLSGQKNVPISIRRSPRSLVLEFLGAYTEGDGHVGLTRVAYATASARLAQELQLLALNLGAVGRRSTVNGYEQLTFLGAESARIARLLHPYLVTPRKRSAAAAAVESHHVRTSNPNLDVIPGLVPALRALSLGSGWFRSVDGSLVRSSFGIFNRTSDNVSYGRASAVPSLLDKVGRLSSKLADTLESILDDQYLWDEVVSVADAGQALTYDFTVPEVHAFISNGIVSHNSGGKTRRAAKMVILDAGHPDILDFIDSKMLEEKKAWALIEQGYDPSFTGEAYGSVFFQNANHSVRVTDEFMNAVVDDGEWTTHAVVDGTPMGTYRARDIFRRMADAAHLCGDPGIQYDTVINNWNPVSNSARQYATNPCSEFSFINDSSCNLASVNLMTFVRDDGVFDVDDYKYACRLTITAQEILVDNAGYPTPRIEENSHKFRPLGLGYANLGALLMSRGLAYDSDEGRNFAAALTSIMTAEAYHQSAVIARDHGGPFIEYQKNEAPFLRVMGMHRDAAYKIPAEGVPADVLEQAHRISDAALELGREHGYRNAQISLLAPTGTIAFMMDCDTTGVEPDIALIKYKKLVGEGFLKIVNQTVPAALRKLGYSANEVEAILAYLTEHETIEGAPALKPEHLSVFDCAFKPQNGVRSIHYMGHVRMMGAIQPFLSGAISKTVNMPEAATAEEIEQVYLEGWKRGLKAIAIYRDNSKRSQPLSTGKKKDGDVAVSEADSAVIEGLRKQLAIAQAEAVKPHRRRLPAERAAVTHRFDISGHEGYITVGLYPDGQPGEIFLKMAKEGSTVSGLMDTFATTVSVALQYGVPLKDLVNKFAHVRFEPSGFTGNQQIPIAKSIVDYIFRWLGSRFLSDDDKANLGLIDRAGYESQPAFGSGGTPGLLAGAGPDPLAGLAAGAPAPSAAAGSPAAQPHSGSPSGRDATDDAPPRATAVATGEVATEVGKSAELSVIATGGHVANGNGKAGNGNGGGMTLALGNVKVAFALQGDAPSCMDCGSIMVRNGSCYKCLNCGSTSGCS
jgi:ribonucleoside-diphosphate reductase alpha chain